LAATWEAGGISDVRVLLASGYSIEGRAAAIMAQGCDGFVQKPFDIEGLSRKIRRILDG
jgi:two-component system, cell cycle sensor histidine kinase and response regulator CckA